MVACASKNRSEGEKVRVSDDIILSSVSSERYLHLAPLSNTEKERIQRSMIVERSSLLSANFP